MKRFIALLLLTSCTVHQDERFQEILLSPRQSSMLRNEHMVRDALLYDSSSGEFAIEPLDAVSHPLISQIYALQGLSLPIEERLLLASYDPLRDKVAVHLDFQLLPDNTLQVFTPKGSEIVREAPFVLKEVLQGQDVELALISKEERTCTKLLFTPHPIRLEEHGAVYTLQTTHRKGTHFRLHGSGLAPHETLILREQSENETRTHTLQADADGRFIQAIEPIVLGRLGGYAHIAIERPSLPPSQLDYAWGGKLEDASQRKTPFCPLVFSVDRDPQEIDAIAMLPQIEKKLTLL